MIKRNAKSSKRYEVRAYDGRKMVRQFVTDNYDEAMNTADKWEYESLLIVEFCDHRPFH